MEDVSPFKGFESAGRKFDEDGICRSTLSLLSSLPSANFFFNTRFVSTVPSAKVRRSVVVIVVTIDSFFPSSATPRDQDDVDEEEDVKAEASVDSSELELWSTGGELVCV